MTAEIPELAIVDTTTWEAAQARRRTINAAPLTQRRGPKRLLSGLLKCGVCGASYIIVTKDHVACSAYRNKGTCDNNRTMRMREIEQRVLTALRQRLLAPDAVATAVEAYRIERQRLSRERARDRSALELEISEVGRQIDRMIASIKDGVDPKLLVADLNNAHAKREALQRQLRLADHAGVAVLRPQAAAAYAQKVVLIQEALAQGDAAALKAVALVRGLVHEIRVTPRPDRMDLEVVGDLVALLEQERDGNKRDFIGGCGGMQLAAPIIGVQGRAAHVGTTVRVVHHPFTALGSALGRSDSCLGPGSGMPMPFAPSVTQRNLGRGATQIADLRQTASGAFPLI